MKKAKLTDVARLAGVSASTVDRVLNKRPGVRPETLARVTAAMQELGYAPSALEGHRSRPILRVTAVLPAGDNEFVGRLDRHLSRVATQRCDVNLRLTIRRADVLDDAEYGRVLNEIRIEQPQGLILMGSESAVARAAINAMIAEGIQVTTLVSDVPQSGRHFYVGIDNFSAGRTAGHLMGRLVGARPGKIGVLIGNFALRDHLDRRSGFEQALMALRPGQSITAGRPTGDRDATAIEATSQLLAENPDLIGLYNIGAGNAGVAEALIASGRSDLVVIGHEVTGVTRKLVLDGTYDALVAQDHAVEAESAIKAVITFCTGERDLSAVPKISIDLFMRENLP